MTLKIISVGPGDPDLMNRKTENTIRSSPLLVLRTARHPLAAWLEAQGIAFRSMDHLYESSEDFEVLASAIASELWSLAAEVEMVVYAVSDSITDRTVDTVISHRPEEGSFEIVPGFSFADFYLPACRGFFQTDDIRICPAASFTGTAYDPSRPILITELNDSISAGEVKRFLSEYIHDEETVLLLDGAKVPKPIQLFELDRQDAYDHLSAVAAGSFSYTQRNRKTLNDLMDIMDTLRSPDGCSWDRVQTHESLTPYVVEEAWEVVDAIQDNHPDHLAEELGDLLFQVVFHTSVAKSCDEFTMDEVISSICEKMIRRHPHVFAGAEKNIQEDVNRTESWDRIKQAETGSKTPVDALGDVSSGLPSLRYAEKILRKMRRIPGMQELSPDEIKALVQHHAASLSGVRDKDTSAKELGALLFCCAALAVSLEADGEILLHQSVKQLIAACQQLEKDGKISYDNPNPFTFKDLGVY